MFFFIFFIFSLPLFSEWIDTTYNKEAMIEKIQILKNGSIEYLYNPKSELQKIIRKDEKDFIRYELEYYYDDEGILTNLTAWNDQKVIYSFPFFLSSPAEEIHISDVEKNQLLKTFLDDKSVFFEYDHDGNRKKKISIKNQQIKQEFYANINKEEIAIFDEKGSIIELKVPGIKLLPTLSLPAIIEIGNTPYIPLLDECWNIHTLISLIDGKKIEQFIDPFGKNLCFIPPFSRFSYRTKIWDDDIKCVFFGYRYYDVLNSRWTSEDPLGAIQSVDLYQYCFEDPKKYIDPDGRFCVVIPLIGSFTITEMIKDIAISTAISLGVDYVVPEINHRLDKRADQKRYEEFVKKQKRTF